MHCSSRPKVMDHGGTSGDRPRRVTISRPNLSVVTSGRVASILHGLQPTETSVPKIAVHPLVDNDVSSASQISDLYDIGCTLGVGTVAVVRKAIRKSDGLQVAIKSIVSDDTEIIFATKKEYNLLKTLNHENIVKVYDLHDFTSSNAGVHLVMECCPGSTLENAVRVYGTKTTCWWDSLDQQVKSVNCFPEPVARNILREILYTVEFLQSKQVLHRDISLRNVIISNPENILTSKIKLIDFNFAQKGDPRVFMTPAGSRHFTAPEVTTQCSPPSKVDVWCAGVCLYYMLTGVLPASAFKHNRRLLRMRLQSASLSSTPNLINLPLSNIIASSNFRSSTPSNPNKTEILNNINNTNYFPCQTNNHISEEAVQPLTDGQLLIPNSNSLIEAVAALDVFITAATSFEANECLPISNGMGLMSNNNGTNNKVAVGNGSDFSVQLFKSDCQNECSKPLTHNSSTHCDSTTATTDENRKDARSFTRRSSNTSDLNGIRSLLSQSLNLSSSSVHNINSELYSDSDNLHIPNNNNTHNNNNNNNNHNHNHNHNENNILFINSSNSTKDSHDQYPSSISSILPTSKITDHHENTLPVASLSCISSPILLDHDEHTKNQEKDLIKCDNADNEVGLQTRFLNLPSRPPVTGVNEVPPPCISSLFGSSTIPEPCKSLSSSTIINSTRGLMVNGNESNEKFDTEEKNNNINNNNNNNENNNSIIQTVSGPPFRDLCDKQVISTMNPRSNNFDFNNKKNNSNNFFEHNNENISFQTDEEIPLSPPKLHYQSSYHTTIQMPISSMMKKSHAHHHRSQSRMAPVSGNNSILSVNNDKTEAAKQSPPSCDPQGSTLQLTTNMSSHTSPQSRLRANSTSPISPCQGEPQLSPPPSAMTSNLLVYPELSPPPAENPPVQSTQKLILSQSTTDIPAGGSTSILSSLYNDEHKKGFAKPKSVESFLNRCNTNGAGSGNNNRRHHHISFPSTSTNNTPIGGSASTTSCCPTINRVFSNNNITFNNANIQTPLSFPTHTSLDTSISPASTSYRTNTSPSVHFTHSYERNNRPCYESRHKKRLSNTGVLSGMDEPSTFESTIEDDAAIQRFRRQAQMQSTERSRELHRENSFPVLSNSGDSRVSSSSNIPVFGLEDAAYSSSSCGISTPHRYNNNSNNNNEEDDFDFSASRSNPSGPHKTRFPIGIWMRVSRSARNLTRWCLQRTPSSRASCAAALSHPWLSDMSRTMHDGPEGIFSSNKESTRYLTMLAVRAAALDGAPPSQALILGATVAESIEGKDANRLVHALSANSSLEDSVRKAIAEQLLSTAANIPGDVITPIPPSFLRQNWAPHSSSSQQEPVASLQQEPQESALQVRATPGFQRRSGRHLSLPIPGSSDGHMMSPSSPLFDMKALQNPSTQNRTPSAFDVLVPPFFALQTLPLPNSNAESSNPNLYQHSGQVEHLSLKRDIFMTNSSSDILASCRHAATPFSATPPHPIPPQDRYTFAEEENYDSTTSNENSEKNFLAMKNNNSNGRNELISIFNRKSSVLPQTITSTQQQQHQNNNMLSNNIKQQNPSNHFSGDEYNRWINKRESVKKRRRDLYFNKVSSSSHINPPFSLPHVVSSPIFRAAVPPISSVVRSNVSNPLMIASALLFASNLTPPSLPPPSAKSTPVVGVCTHEASKCMCHGILLPSKSQKAFYSLPSLHPDHSVPSSVDGGISLLFMHPPPCDGSSSTPVLFRDVSSILPCQSEAAIRRVEGNCFCSAARCTGHDADCESLSSDEGDEAELSTSRDKRKGWKHTICMHRVKKSFPTSSSSSHHKKDRTGILATSSGSSTSKHLENKDNCFNQLDVSRLLDNHNTSSHPNFDLSPVRTTALATQCGSCTTMNFLSPPAIPDSASFSPVLCVPDVAAFEETLNWDSCETTSDSDDDRPAGTGTTANTGPNKTARNATRSNKLNSLSSNGEVGSSGGGKCNTTSPWAVGDRFTRIIPSSPVLSISNTSANVSSNSLRSSTSAFGAGTTTGHASSAPLAPSTCGGGGVSGGHLLHRATSGQRSVGGVAFNPMMVSSSNSTNSGNNINTSNSGSNELTGVSSHSSNLSSSGHSNSRGHVPESSPAKLGDGREAFVSRLLNLAASKASVPPSSSAPLSRHSSCCIPTSDPSSSSSSALMNSRLGGSVRGDLPSRTRAVPLPANINDIGNSLMTKNQISFSASSQNRLSLNNNNNPWMSPIPDLYPPSPCLVSRKPYNIINESPVGRVRINLQQDVGANINKTSLSVPGSQGLNQENMPFSLKIPSCTSFNEQVSDKNQVSDFSVNSVPSSAFSSSIGSRNRPPAIQFVPGMRSDTARHSFQLSTLTENSQDDTGNEK